MAKWDAFISHASEDKITVARPLSAMLEHRGLRVWLDENELVLGHGLMQQIDKGLGESDFGVVILSKAFFEKRWTRLELDALLNSSLYREKWLIPVWHEIDRAYLLERSPILASRFAANTADTLAVVANQILQTVRPHKPVDSPSFEERQALSREFVEGLRSHKWSGRSFTTDIGKFTMNQIRSLLRVEDSDPLLALLTDTRQSPAIRNRAGSLLFGDRLRGHRKEFERLRTVLHGYYKANVETDAWQVLRAVALAVADQVNDSSLIRDWLDRIRQSEGLIEANLAMSDEYNGGRQAAVGAYMKRVSELFSRYPAGRYWEVFYLGRRGVHGDGDLIAILKECRDHTKDAGLQTLCNESFGLLT